MEYLVKMTTHVPDGTPDQAVDDVRAREAAHSRELAAAGPFARAGPVERRESRRDAGVLEVAAHGSVDDRRDHAAQPAPKRPGDDHPVTRNDRRVAIITGGSQGIGAGLVAGYLRRD